MEYLPDLTDAQAHALQLILAKGVVRGRQLEHELHVKPEDLLEIVGPLLKHELIEADGNVFDPKEIRSAHFSYSPAAQALIQNTLRKKL